MRITFTAVAESDISAALDWYDHQAPGIGIKFLAELDAILRRLSENPQQFQLIDGKLRRAGFRRFPYGLFFHLKDEAIEVVACFHASRNPQSWQARG